MDSTTFQVGILAIFLLLTGCTPLPAKYEATYSVPCSVRTSYHRVYDYSHFPPRVDTEGTAERKPPSGKMLVGYENSWNVSGVGGVNHRYLGFTYRGFVFFDRGLLPAKGLVLKAELRFKNPETQNWTGGSASNTGSAANSLSILTAPFSGYYSTGESFTELPSTSGATSRAAYNPHDGLVVDVTTPINRIVNGFDPNHGFMLIGANEKFEHNNDSFLSTYEAPRLLVRVLEDKPQWPTQ